MYRGCAGLFQKGENDRDENGFCHRCVAEADHEEEVARSLEEDERAGRI